MRTLILLIALLTAFVKLTVFAQDKSNWQTYVIELSTGDPNNLSIQRFPAGKQRRFLVKDRLEIKSKYSTSFKITEINPLRYKYFINNVAVTQFMDPASVSIPIGQFKNGDLFSVVPEIKIPEIFKIDSIDSPTRKAIVDYQNELSIADDSILQARQKLISIWTQIDLATMRQDTNVTRSYSSARSKYLSDDRVLKLFDQLTTFQARKTKLIQIYQGTVALSPLNNGNFGLIKAWREIDIDDDEIEPIRDVRVTKRDFAIAYEKMHSDFLLIENVLGRLDGVKDYFEADALSQDRTNLKNMVAEYGLYWPESELQRLPYFPDGDYSIYRQSNDLLRKQILNKRAQFYSEFVMSVAAKIGYLVQTLSRSASAYNNELESFNSISQDEIQKIADKKRQLEVAFDLIQITSAELQIIVSYMAIDNAQYKSIANRINSNYLYLLNYLKNLSFLIRNNTVQYTLPTNSNLRNIDLVRYSISREDRISKNVQSYEYDLWIRGGIKVDFSVAFLASLLTDRVYNKTLVSTVGDIETIRVRQQEDRRADFAFGGMVNLVPRNGARWLNLGLSMGVAYASNQTLQFLTSGALHLGKTERVILHYGASFGKVKRLDLSQFNYIKDGDEFLVASPDVKFTSFTPIMFDKFCVRPFFGISYNLSKKNALQAISDPGLSTYQNNMPKD